ncbi:unnamed protein product [Ilex paraguariensis]|uniref:peptidylprolyl isomerase n=1 Tax=Ilex paraguariensis TaxID=185542 RepID=A0ABC8RI01_9AQUA
MSSLPFSLLSLPPTNHSTSITSCLLYKNLHTTEASSAKSTSHHITSSHLLKLNENSTLCARREVIGLGVCSGLLQVLLQPQAFAAAAAAEAEASPCELTETPSGLAYCDKALGSGPEAVKGQLIKAHYVGKLENGKVFDSSYNRGKPLTFRIGVGQVRTIFSTIMNCILLVNPGTVKSRMNQ